MRGDPATGFTKPSPATRGPYSGGTSSPGAFGLAVVLGGREVRDA